MSMWGNYRNCKYMFLFMLRNTAHVWYLSFLEESYRYVADNVHYQTDTYTARECTHQSICNIDKDIDGLVQDCSNSIALAMELLQPCTKSSISKSWKWQHKGFQSQVKNIFIVYQKPKHLQHRKMNLSMSWKTATLMYSNSILRVFVVVYRPVT